MGVSERRLLCGNAQGKTAKARLVTDCGSFSISRKEEEKKRMHVFPRNMPVARKHLIELSRCRN